MLITKEQLTEILHMFVDRENPDGDHHGLASINFSNPYRLEEHFLTVQQETEEIIKFVNWYWKEFHNDNNV